VQKERGLTSGVEETRERMEERKTNTADWPEQTARNVPIPYATPETEKGREREREERK
jgi:hypothetical protein